MKTNFKITLIALCLCGGTAFAQVGMTGNNPHRSAALDINATDKGMLLSNMNLASTTDISGITGGQPANSLLVYNGNASITGTGAAGAGYYYWDATATPAPIWKKLLTPADITNNGWALSGNLSTTGTNYLGTNDNKDLIIKTGGAEKMRISPSGNVGIGTTAPSQKLEVNGTTKIGGTFYLGTAGTAPQTNISPLAVDNATGQVYVVNAGAASKPYNYIKYTIQNVNADFIADFNTNIPTNKYTLVVVGSSFDRGIRDFNPNNVYAFSGGGTWHLYADYGGTDTYDGSNGTWTLYCLVINNSMLKTLSPINFNLGGSATGSAGSAPSGL